MMIAAMMMVMTVSANSMSYSIAKQEALFLSDKMAHELKLTNGQYDDVYEINLDYLMNVNGYNDAYGSWWKRRNNDLKFVLSAYQYKKYTKLNYFYCPLNWEKGNWSFGVHKQYKDRNSLFKGNPKGFASYKGGNNKKSDRFYADRNSSHSKSYANNRHSNNSTNIGRNNGSAPSGRSSGSTPSGRSNGSPHPGGR